MEMKLPIKLFPIKMPVFIYFETSKIQNLIEIEELLRSARFIEKFDIFQYRLIF